MMDDFVLEPRITLGRRAKRTLKRIENDWDMMYDEPEPFFMDNDAEHVDDNTAPFTTPKPYIDIVAPKQDPKSVHEFHCSICWAESAKEIRVTRKCNHAFCAPCIQKWLQCATRCGYCNQSLAS
jgi:hypothetical protein